MARRVTGTAESAERGPPGPALEDRALGFIWDQGAVRPDQLGRYLGLDGPSLAELIGRLLARGWVRREESVGDRHRWLFLRRAGALAAGGTAVPRVRAWSLDHRAAVNEVRLLISSRAPGGRWVPERVLRARADGRLGVPDGVFEVDGARYAIEVELTPKDRPRWRAILVERFVRYDAVVYFCVPRVAAALRALVREWELSERVEIRALPAGAMPARRPARRRRGPRRVPTGRQPAAIGLIAEQGGVPVDQLASLLAISPAEARELAAALCRDGFARSWRFAPPEPLWLTLTDRGAGLSGTGTRPFELRPGRIRYLRTVNELRRYVCSVDPSLVWVSSRILRGPPGRRGPRPVAAVLDGDRRHAVVVLGNQSRRQLLLRLVQLVGSYDLVYCYCSERAGERVEAIRAERGWQTVVVRPLGPVWSPAGRGFVPGPSERRVLVLLAEQVVAEEGQLASLSGCEPAELGRCLSRLSVAGLVRLSHEGLFPGGLYSATPRGVSASGTELAASSLPTGVSALRRLRAVTQARVDLCAGREDRWVSRRVLVRGMGVRAGGAPQAVLERGARRLAVEVLVGPKKRRERLRGLLAERVADHDGVVCVCPPGWRGWAEDVAAEVDVDRIEVCELGAGAPH